MNSNVSLNAANFSKLQDIYLILLELCYSTHHASRFPVNMAVLEYVWSSKDQGFI